MAFEASATRQLVLIGVAAFALAPGGADAAGGERADLEVCAALENDRERLRCFDDLVKRGPERGGPSGTAAKAGVAQRDPEADFGSDTLKGAEPDAPEEVASIGARIEALERRPHGEYVFRLSNGQVWTELSAGRRRYREGTDVTIRRTAFGGYMLSTGQGRATRVRRVE